MQDESNHPGLNFPSVSRRGGRGQRKPIGKMNRTEARYAEHLEFRRLAGEIYSYQFEAVKLRLGNNLFVTWDFFVHLADDSLEFHDVKGRKSDGSFYAEEDAIIKVKTAARLFPFRFFFVWPNGTAKTFTGWNSKEFVWP